MFPATGEDLVIRIYQTVAVRRNVQEIRFQTYSDDKKDFFDKRIAYAESDIGNGLHRQHVYRVRVNNVSQYPFIKEILVELCEADLVPQKVGAG